MTLAMAVDAPRGADTRIAAVVLALQAFVTLVVLGATDARLETFVSIAPPLIPLETSAPLVAEVLVSAEAVRGILAALLVVCVVQAILTVMSRRGTLSARTASTLHWVAASQALGITIVIVALLNGAGVAATIVLGYALAASGGMLGWLQDRTARAESSRGHLWAYAFMTVLVIVPWGAVALVQITGLVLGAPASAGVRITTLVILAVTAVWAAAEWAIARPAGVARTSEGAARLRILSVTMLASVPAGAVLVLAVAGG